MKYFSQIVNSDSHPVDEKRLDELDDLQCDQETDGDQVVEENDEGEKVQAEVSSSSIYKGLVWSYRHKRVINRRLISDTLSINREFHENVQSYFQLMININLMAENGLGQR